MMVKIKCLIISLFLFWSITGLSAVVATVDRDEISPTDSIVLTISSTDTTTETPELSVLAKDFDLLSRGQNVSVEIINGKARRFTSWQIAMRPKHSGSITIPAIKVGTQQTKSIPVKVSGHVVAAKSSSQSQDFFIESEISPKTAYVQQQLIYTQRVWCGKNIRNGQLSPLTVQGQGKANIERIGEDQQSSRTRNGKFYQVIERRYVVFPQESGELTLEAPELRAVTFNSIVGYWDQPDPTQIRVMGKPLKLTIKPQPASFTGTWWLPAEQVKLTEEWSDTTNAQVGEPITRTVTLQANGIKASQLPELKFDYPHGFNSYPDKSVMTNKAEKNLVIGTRQFKVALIPTLGGELTIPEYKLPWFNTISGKTEVAILPAKKITVMGAVAPQINNEPKPVVTPAPKPVFAQQADNFWQWLVIAFAALWVITFIMLIWVVKRRKSALKVSLKKNPSLKQASKAIYRACQSNNAKVTQQAILSWARAKWPNQGISTLQQVAEQFADTELHLKINELLTACYRNTAASWEGKSFWKAWEVAVTTKVNQESKDELPSLYG